MASIRKRTWTTGGKVKTAWVVDYFDQHGKRRLKTFETKKAADAWRVTAQHEVSQGSIPRRVSASRLRRPAIYGYRRARRTASKHRP